MNQKIISIHQHKKLQKKELLKKTLRENAKMLFFTIVVGAVIGLLAWNYFIENVSNLDVKIPESKNIAFNQEAPIPMTTAQIANEFENSDSKPVLLYIYTTWCQTCVKNFPTINEISREFQNTDLQIITLAIDRDITPEQLQSYLNKYGNVYFQPRFLAFKEGFLEFLQKKHIRYNNRIPFTALISRDGEVLVQYSGAKSKNYLRNKIIKELFQ